MNSRTSIVHRSQNDASLQMRRLRGPCRLPATECFDDGENLHAFCDKHYERVVADFKESE